MSDTEEITTAAGRFRVRIEYDDSGESPREWSNLGAITLSASRASRIGDVMDDTNVSRRDDVVDCVADERDSRTMVRYVMRKYGATVVLPIRRNGRDGDLIVADESGTDYQGAIYDTPESRAECGEPTDMRAALIAELEVYNKWARGEFVGFIVERFIPACEHGHGDEWVHVESVWGFDDEEYARSEALDVVAQLGSVGA